MNQFFQCNVHLQDRIGMVVRGRCPGMRFKDNEFNNIIADLRLQRNFTTPGQIHLNQGANNAAIYNYFSNNAADISSSNAANQTVQFSYFPPDVEIQAERDRATPDCDIIGFQAPANAACAILNNFDNKPYSQGVKNACLGPFQKRDYVQCKDKNCLDALRSQKMNLEQLVNDGQSNKKPALATAKLRFDTDKHDLAWKWFAANHLDSIVMMLTAYNTVEDLQMVYSYSMRARSYAAASNLLESLPEPTQDDAQFKQIQRIYLKYAKSSGFYVATAAEDQLLISVAANATTAGTHARSTYYLLHGIWLEPELDNSASLAMQGMEDRGQVASLDVMSNMLLAPNPANDQVMAKVQSHTDGTIQVLDLQGNILQSIPLKSGTAEIFTSKLANGMYLVRHQSIVGQTLSVQKLVVQH